MKNRMDEWKRLKIKNKSIAVFVRVFRFFMLVTMSYLFLFPLYYMLVVSLQRPDLAVDPTSVYVPKAFSLQAYKVAFEQLDYSKSALLSAVITIFSTVGVVVSCSMTGYAFARFRFKGKSLIFALVLLMIVVPPQQTIVPQYMLYRFFDFGGLLSLFGVNLNLLNSPWVFILPSMFAAGLKAGMFIFIFRQFFLGQPKELEEAAKIDGCGAFKTFTSIMVPLAKPAFVVVVMLCVIWHWNEFYSSSMFFVRGTKPLIVNLDSLRYAVSGGHINLLGENGGNAYVQRMFLQAGAVLTILPPFILYAFMQKLFIESLDRTGIVG